MQHDPPSDKPRLLFQLDENLVLGRLVQRPSKRNKSPYVADVWLEDEQREAIVHVPNLDMGGKCVPGVKLLMKYATDGKGQRVGAEAVGKYGTPKCEFIAQLLQHVSDHAIDQTLYQPTWIGAHPSLGERIALKWLETPGLIFDDVLRVDRQVTNPGGVCEKRPETPIFQGAAEVPEQRAG